MKLGRTRTGALIAATAAATVTAATFTTGTAPRAAAPVSSVQAKAFQHPGVLVGKRQLDFVRAKVKARKQPWKRAYDAMLASREADLKRVPKPRAIVECGPSSNPDHGCSDERTDAMAAYTNALAWRLSRDPRRARKAIQLMDAWSAKLRDHQGSNAPLQASWAAANFSRAAELVAHSPAPWPNRARFARLLRDVYLPLISQPLTRKNGNWELIATDATIGVAVHLDDRRAFDRAVAAWRLRLPQYVYLKKDGPLPRTPAGIEGRAATVRYWHGQTTFTDGLAQETCRDFGHTGWGLAAALHVAETARLQGVDLYETGRTRLTRAMEFHARYERGAKPPASLCKGTLKRGLGPTLEIGYNAYHHRLGASLPNTARYVTGKRPAGAGHFLGWETLTHAGTP